ncbi:YdiK family protein [Amphibacillus jilinensis]|uniref:YdiK family protein n=1 Tax=Amphibacillus jilinensis TaxID=1216008 RepID=UPI0002DB4A5D|nr:YdiK family protein [Amphibacillus jilinensis]
MRISPLLNAVVYGIVGAIFIYFAYQSIDDDVLNPITILLTAVAALQFGVAIRLIHLHIRIKRKQKQNKK